MDLRQLPLETQVAQLFMVGYAGLEPNPVTERFLSAGVGGLIFFRDNLDGLQHPQTVIDRLHRLQARRPAGCPRLLMGIDQEGGQVERLPHTLFPTALTPRAVALSPHPEALARHMYTAMARGLRALGFNLNFFPTLDVNFNRLNPIIGVRSFGDQPGTVWRLAHIAQQAFAEQNLIAVGKHFPGHGNGTVDSHLDLPTLQFTQAELWPFRQAIAHGLPAMLVAHGLYPVLQGTPQERHLPSSASPAIIGRLLRQELGFEGVVITDDMCMGAITRHRDPIEAALAALRAGVDILLYKQSTETEWAVYQAVVQAVRRGDWPLEQLHAALARIAHLKARFLDTPQPAWPWTDPSQPHTAIARRWAQQGIGLISGTPAPLQPQDTLLVVHPDRATMGNYAFDTPSSPDLSELMTRQFGASRMAGSLCYPVRPDDATDVIQNLPDSANPSVIVMIRFHPHRFPSQNRLAQCLRQRYPHARWILTEAGGVYPDALSNLAVQTLSLCSYRPATLEALTHVLAHGYSPDNPHEAPQVGAY